MPSIRRAAALAVGIGWLCWQASMAIAEEPQRVISFPEKAVGTVFYFYGGSQINVPARGRVTIPAGAQRRSLQVSYDEGERPQFLLTLKPDDLEGLDLSNTAADDRSCACLTHLSGLKEINLGFTDIGDECVKQLTVLANLRELDLQATRITDKSAGELARMHLNWLCVGRTKITDAFVAGLKHSNIGWLRLTQVGITDRVFDTLRAMPDLYTIDLDTTPVTDAGLKRLAGDKSLLQLCLHSDPKITDASIDALATLSGLRVLDVGASGITPGGLAKLQKKLPHCRMSERKSRLP